MLNKILELIYPPVCGVCQKLDSNSLCKKCEIELKKQAVFGVDNYTNNKEKFFDEHLYIFMYSGIIRKIILNYKFRENSYLYKTFIKFLLKDKKFVEIIKKYDIIIPVPLSKKREKERGYNQSVLIAKELSTILGLQYSKNCLRKVKDIKPQSSLNKEERQKNIQDAYELNNYEKLKRKNVLIVDDIYTTGSTINECSKTIKKSGAKKIGVLTIAKD